MRRYEVITMLSERTPQSHWREKSQAGERNYEAFSSALDLIRSSFFSLHMGYSNEERWRWDAPVVNFNWENGAESVSRNINGFVLGEANPTGVQVEANAWYDVQEGERLFRYWRHFPIGRIDSIDSDKIGELVTQAYNEVSTCSKKEIENSIELQN